MKTKKTFTKAQEDFLETLVILEEQGLPLETTRVAKMLGISKPAVHQMGHELIDRGLITRRDYGDIKLTDQGREVGIAIYKIHKGLVRFLTTIGVSEEQAKIDACEIEHVISQESNECLIALAERMSKCPHCDCGGIRIKSEIF